MTGAQRGGLVEDVAMNEYANEHFCNLVMGESDVVMLMVRMGLLRAVRLVQVRRCLMVNWNGLIIYIQQI